MVNLPGATPETTHKKAEAFASVEGNASDNSREMSKGELVEHTPLLLALLLINVNNNPANTGGAVPEVVVPTVQTIELQAPETQPLTLKLRAAPKEKVVDGLTASQVQDWNQHGYLVIPDALSANEVNDLTRSIEEHVERLFSPSEDVKVHSYSPGQSAYVLPCGRRMVTLTEVNGYSHQNSTLSPMQRIQRIGCGAHLHFSSVHRAVHSHRNASIAQSLGLRDPSIVDCTIMSKAAGTGRKIGSHQDGGSLYTGAVTSGVTFWYALQDSTVENGCLEVARGTHRLEPIRTRAVLGECGQARNVELDEPLYAGLDHLDPSTLPKKNEAGDYDFTKLPVSAGTLIVLHGNLLHTSAANKSDSNRMAMKFSVVDGRHSWPHDNYLQPGREGGFEKLRGLY